MSHLVMASCTTLGILIASLICKVKRHPYVYVLIFFICLFFRYGFDALCAEMPQEILVDHPFTARFMEISTKGKWEENDRGQYEYKERNKEKDHSKHNNRKYGNKRFAWEPAPYIEYEDETTEQSIMKNFISNTQEKIDYHFEEGMRCFREAEEICLWFPNMDDREKARLCFEEILAMAMPGGGNVKLLSAIVVSISKFGPKVMDNWHLLHSRLCESKHHFEMQEFYTHVGKYVQAQLEHKIEENKKNH